VCVQNISDAVMPTDEDCIVLFQLQNTRLVTIEQKEILIQLIHSVDVHVLSDDIFKQNDFIERLKKHGKKLIQKLQLNLTTQEPSNRNLDTTQTTRECLSSMIEFVMTVKSIMDVEINEATSASPAKVPANLRLMEQELNLVVNILVDCISLVDPDNLMRGSLEKAVDVYAHNHVELITDTVMRTLF
jgi:hypothetical protein